MLHQREPALLVLEDGTSYPGEAYGAQGAALGEIVFNTGMTGYQETLTDPSYHGQIVVMTAPHIGNTGVNDEDPESGRIWVAGYVVRDPSPVVSNWRAKTRHDEQTGDEVPVSLEDELAGQDVVGICGIDTRALTRRIREVGAMRAGIFSGLAIAGEAGRPVLVADLIDQVVASPRMEGADLAGQVATRQPYEVLPQGEPVATVVAIDLGIKSMTPQRLAQRGVRTVVLPGSASLEEVLSCQPDGVFFSNGPGDPATAEGPVALLREILARRIPFFGICFGNQLLGRALGFDTYKLAYGHRGINQPVLDRATGRVEVTAHNHGFAVAVPLDGPVQAPYDGGRFGRVQVSHVGLNDQVVEGIACLDIPAFSVQYHPEAAAGPHDAGYLFDRFVAMMTREGKEAADATA